MNSVQNPVHINSDHSREDNIDTSNQNNIIQLNLLRYARQIWVK